MLWRHNIQLLFAAHPVALHDYRERFLLCAGAHDQGRFATTSVQCVGEQAANSSRAQYMPVWFSHGQNTQCGIENWWQPITM
jgi:hypothetical protein